MISKINFSKLKWYKTEFDSKNRRYHLGDFNPDTHPEYHEIAIYSKILNNKTIHHIEIRCDKFGETGRFIIVSPGTHITKVKKIAIEEANKYQDSGYYFS